MDILVCGALCVDQVAQLYLQLAPAALRLVQLLLQLLQALVEVEQSPASLSALSLSVLIFSPFSFSSARILSTFFLSSSCTVLLWLSSST